MKNEKLNPKRIGTVITNKCVLELINKFELSDYREGGYIHRCRSHDDNNIKLKDSLVGITLIDYSKKPSVIVNFNISASAIDELYFESLMKRKDYVFSENGLKKVNAAQGGNKVHSLHLKRDGKLKNPWVITIKNGITNGAEYNWDKEVTMYITDAEFRKLMVNALTFKNIWEQVYGTNIIKQNTKYAEEWQRNHMGGNKDKDTTKKKVNSSRENNDKTMVKKMKIKFLSQFTEVKDTHLLYACVTSNDKNKGEMWFEPHDIKKRESEFKEALETGKSIQVKYKIQDNIVYYVA